MQNSSVFQEWYEKETVINKYIKESPRFKEVIWSDLPNSTQIMLKEWPKEIKKRGKSNYITIGRLKKQCNQKERINSLTLGIKKSSCSNSCLPLSFPINLKDINYVKLYSLMASEGSKNTEFSLHVPEDYFHTLFKETIKNLFGSFYSSKIKVRENKGFLRSRAPAKTRFLIPCPKHIPKIILKNKEFAREYLKVAFDAEGSAIFDGKCKRYIKLSRYCNISNFVKESLPLQKRIYSQQIKSQYPSLYEKIKEYPPQLLLGEQILLRKHFNIKSQLNLEAFRRNKTSFRAGEITARWVLFIYANNINTFIKEIGFISKEKNNVCKKMLTVNPRKPQYFSLKIIKKVSKKGVFLRKEFIIEMKLNGYKSPGCYLHRYENKGLIKRIGKGKYVLLIN